MKQIGKILLFFSSFLPCWLIFALNENRLVSYSGIAMILISLTTLGIFKTTYKAVSLEGKSSIFIKSISNGSAEVVSYLLTIVIPVATSASLSQILEGKIDLSLLVFTIIGVMLFVVFISSNLVVINPMLILLRYSLYLIDYSNTKDENGVLIKGVLITKSSFDPETLPSEIILEKIGSNVYMYFG